VGLAKDNRSVVGEVNRKNMNFLRLAPVILLVFSNIFMTYAWYGHLKDFRAKPLLLVILLSWGVAFFEYCLQVPANRLGSASYSLAQLKIIQEILTIPEPASLT
jgi:uncharacterized protein (DUF486 family)